MMKPEILERYFVFFLIALGLVLAFYTVRPFIYVLVLSAVFAFLFEPIHKRLERFFHGQRLLPAILTILIIVGFIIIPVIFLTFRIIAEALQVYTYLSEPNINSAIHNFLSRHIPLLKNETVDVNSYFKAGLNWIIQNLGTIFSNTIRFVVDIFIFLFSLYYFLKEGRSMIASLKKITPLQEKFEDIILHRLGSGINSIFKGQVVVALLDGIVSSLGMTIFGVPNAILWGTTVFAAALLPGIGTTLVLTPIAIYLFATAPTITAMGFAIWAILTVSFIDNYIGPRVIGQSAELHPLLVLVAILGGLVFYGPIGFILGPLTMSFCFSVLEVYKKLEVERKSPHSSPPHF